MPLRCALPSLPTSFRLFEARADLRLWRQILKIVEPWMRGGKGVGHEQDAESDRESHLNQEAAQDDDR